MEDTRIHKETGLLVRNDGAVYMRIKSSNNYRWTYGSKNGGGYMKIKYKGKMYRVHRLVADCFIPNTEGKPQVDHINMKRDDNRVENLRWATQKENLTFDDQNVQNRRVVKRSKKVLQFTLDEQLVNEWSSTAEAGRNGFAQSHISACCRGELNKHKGYKWRYA